MTFIAKKPPSLALDDGAVLDGYTVERVEDAHAVAELRYAVTAPGGERATLHLSRRAFADRDERARFRRLAALRANFVHPAAIEVSGFGEHIGHPYLVTEAFGPARTFGDLLEDEAPLEPGRLVELLEPVAGALDIAHSQGLVHEALGADSLLLAGDDQLLLDSFALFELGGESPWTTLQQADLRYRAPEQIRADPLGPSANVYSLGALIVHALTGEPPYRGDRLALEYAHATQPAPSISQRAPELDPAIDAVINRALAKWPSRRPGTATELLAQVAEALGVETTLPPVDLPAFEETLPAEPAELTLPADTSAFVEGAPVDAPDHWRLAATGDAHPGRHRSFTAQMAIAALVAILCGSVLALALDPFGGEEPPAQPSPPASVWNRLDAERTDLRAELAAAKTPQEQADLARRIAGAYEDAARAAGPGGHARAARAVRDAYTDLAAAAVAGEKSGYSQASDAIAQAEQRLQARR
jgi:serine/threonine protein kinase, bacterial